ncbi:putative nucleoside-diphosphate kinase [Helianthus anomalus]
MKQTFIMIKPDGLQRGFVGEIIDRFEKKGFTLKGLKLLIVDKALAEKHYVDLSSKPFFNGLVNYIISRPVVMIWEGKYIVTAARNIIGATNSGGPRIFFHGVRNFLGVICLYNSFRSSLGRIRSYKKIIK